MPKPSKSNPAPAASSAGAGVTGPLSRTEWRSLGIAAFAGLLLRVVFMPLRGHITDVNTFASWLLTLNRVGTKDFYVAGQFSDYSPGYMLVLWAFGQIYKVVTVFTHGDPDFSIVRLVCKVPAVTADIGMAFGAYLIVRRIWGSRAALWTTAIVVLFNPAIWMVSGYWGQVDSVAAVCLVFCVYFAVVERYELAWAALAVAVLIKPQPLVVAPLLLLWQIRSVRSAKDVARLLWVPVIGVAVAYLGSLPFSPNANPPDVLSWLIDRYRLGTSVYQVNSANAFNIYSVARDFWQPDNAPISLPDPSGLPLAGALFRTQLSSAIVAMLGAALAVLAFTVWRPRGPGDAGRENLQLGAGIIGLAALGLGALGALRPIGLFSQPQYVWGILLFVVLLAAVSWRAWRLLDPALPQAQRERSLHLAMFLALLGFFMLTTRMHERYLFSALALAPLLWNVGPVHRWIVGILSFTFVADLFYALAYLDAPGQDLNPAEVHVLSAVNVVCLFVVAAMYLIEEAEPALVRALGLASGGTGSLLPKARAVPNVAEGLVGMTRRDYAIAATLTAATGILVFWNIATPAERIFDEIYYARAAQEYISKHDLFEYTHPPLTKLIMTVGQYMFSGVNYKSRHDDHLGHADPLVLRWSGALPFLRGLAFPDPVGARIMAALFGTLTVFVLYAFAKRLFGSTALAIVAVLLLVSSGYHYVQSRIATPEIFVAFFALLTLYCAYRYWTASQVTALGATPPRVDWAGVALAAAVPVSLLVFGKTAFALANAAFNDPGVRARFDGMLVGLFIAYLFVLAAVLAFALLRLRRSTGERVSFPDGAVLERDAIVLNDGRATTFKLASNDIDGQRVEWSREGAIVVDGDAQLAWRRSGVVEGTLAQAPVRDEQQWALWLAATAGAVGCVIASKWNGLFDLALLWAVAFVLTGQPLLRQARALLGNPYGWRLPAFVACTLVVPIVIYYLTNLPYFWQGNGHQFFELVAMQYNMYRYHHDLVATHPYASAWWTWPLELRPVSYYYHQFTPPTAAQQIVAEIIALPNPAMWWGGLVTVPLAAALAWRARHKGVLLLVAAYAFQWLPWIASTRIDFQYNFYPNVAIICLCGAYVIGWLWGAQHGILPADRAARVRRAIVAAYALAVVAGFVFFYPIWSADHITYDDWARHMWLKTNTWIGWI